MRQQHWTYNCDCCNASVTRAETLTLVKIGIPVYHSEPVSFDACHDCMVKIRAAAGSVMLPYDRPEPAPRRFDEDVPF